MAAIGQSDNNYTTVALSRYVTAVASGKNIIISWWINRGCRWKDGQKYKADYEDISDTLTSSQWDAIHSGMREVVSTMDRFQGFDIPVAGKPVRHSRPDMPIMVCLLVMRHMMIRKLPSQYELPTVTVPIMRQPRQEM